MTHRRSTALVAWVSATVVLIAAAWLTGMAPHWHRGLALSEVEGSAPQRHGRLALSDIEGLALSKVEGLALSRVEGSAPPREGAARQFRRETIAPAIVPSPADNRTQEAAGALERSVVAVGPDHAVETAPDANRVQLFEVCRTDTGRTFGIAEAIQQCIDRAPAFSSVEILPGTYILQKQLVVSTPLTIRTAGTANTSLSCVHDPDRCAVLKAGPNMIDPFGVLLVQSTNNVTLEHVVLDGNRSARLSSVAARWCPGNNIVGFNAAVVNCLGCGLDDVLSRNALCGSGMVWSGPQALIQRSAFVGNGDSATPGMWADGLTLLYAPESEIRQNQFVDNSDVALIIGYGVHSRIEQNTIVQRAQGAFAGLMLDNFNSDNLRSSGDFRDAVIADNTVDCGAQLCVFGIQVGPRPWYASTNIVGGDIHGNTIRGAKVGINVDGAGIAGAPIRIFANAVSNVPPASYFSDCARDIPTDWMNVAPTSVVDRHDELSTTGANLSDPCQLMSAIEPDAP